MNLKITLFYLVLYSIFTHLFAGFSYAVTVPQFPTCSAPSGSLKAQYTSGIHGIAGNTAEYRGSDAVYQVTNDTLIQCFCPQSGNEGIQTNWRKVANLSESEIQTLKNQGWIYITNGSLWGLENAPYLAKNLSYQCKGQGGSLLGVSTKDVLGFAKTGNSLLLFSVAGLGLTFLLIGARLRKVHG